MEKREADQLIMLNMSKLAPEYVEPIREQLMATDYNRAVMIFSTLKDPTIAMILSVLLGVYGVDRFYIGDVGIGAGKLLTGGGCGIWWIIDLFFIMGATKQKNTEKVMQMLAYNTY